MTRKIFAIATALLAAPALFASAAEACISCEYVPEVVRGSQTSCAQVSMCVSADRNLRAASRA